ncbi:MAG: hypothetical protein WBI74_04755 [Caldicoprobacterales bacterium]|jgi:K+-sensing histidine kinase KdpD|nr:universal stress protein UspA [Clostridiales bacterium]
MGKSHNVLICVTRQRSCERLIRVGYERSKLSGGKPYVIHVAPIGENFLGNPKEGEALDYLFDISKQVGAEMTVLRSDEVVEVLSSFSEKHGIGIMVLGEPPKSQHKSNIIERLKRKLKDVEFIVVPA